MEETYVAKNRYICTSKIKKPAKSRHTMVAKKKLQRGMLLCAVLISIQIIYIFIPFSTEYHGKEIKAVYHISVTFLYISILQIVRTIISKNASIEKIITWILKTEMVKAVSLVLLAFQLEQAQILVTACGIASFVLHVIFSFLSFSKKHNGTTEITALRPFSIAILLNYTGAILLFLFGRSLGEKPVMNSVIWLQALTQIFIIQYFYTLVKNSSNTETEQ